MADADPVDITVRIKNEFSDEIETLKAELGSIQDKVEAQLEINDNGDIDWAKMELESLERLIEAVLELDTEGVEQAEAQLDALDGRETESTHEVDVHKDGDNFDPPSLDESALPDPKKISGMDYLDADALGQIKGKLDPRNGSAVGEYQLRNAIFGASNDQSNLSRGQKMVDEMFHDGKPGTKAIPGGLPPSGITRGSLGMRLDRRLGSQDRFKGMYRDKDGNLDLPYSNSSVEPDSGNKFNIPDNIGEILQDTLSLDKLDKSQFKGGNTGDKSRGAFQKEMGLSGEAAKKKGDKDYDSEDPKRRKFKNSGFQIDPEALETILQLVDADDPIGDDPRENNRNYDSEDVEKRNFKNDGFSISSATEGDLADNIARLFGDGPEQIDITDPRMVNLDDMSEALNNSDRLNSENDMPDPRSNLMSNVDFEMPNQDPMENRELIGTLPKFRQTGTDEEGSAIVEDVSPDIGSGNVSFGVPDMEQGNLDNRVVPNPDIPGKEKKGLNFDKMGGGLSKFNKKLKKLFPSMRKWMNLVAALGPMLISLAGAAVGLGAALGGLAVAGGAIMGLGLLGWGDSLKKSMKNSKKRVKEFKKELYSVFKPAIETFQPIADDFLSGLPGKLNGVVDALQKLTVFEGVLNRGVNAFIGIVERSIEAIYDMRTEITALASATMSAFSGKIVQFFKNMVKHVYKNWKMFTDLAAILINVVSIIYNLAMIVSRVIVTFKPLFNILAMVSRMLSNKFVVGLLTAIATAYGLITALAAISSLLGFLAGGGLWAAIVSGIGSFITMMTGAEVTATTLTGIINGLTASTLAWATALGIATAGLSILAGMAAASAISNSMPDVPETPRGGSMGSGGYRSMGTGGGSGGDTYIMKVDGNTREEHVDQFKDMAENREYWQSSEESARNTGDS